MAHRLGGNAASGNSRGRCRAAARLRDAVAPAARTLTAGSCGHLDALESRLLLAASDVTINEIMYNSASAETADEYVELFNKGTTPVSLSGWRLAKGVDFTFGNTTIPAGGYLVVAADLARFAQKYPAVTNVVGNWTGTLSNSANTIQLLSATGLETDKVDYADDGDWAARRRGGETPLAIAGITGAGTTATVTTAASHGYAAGNQVAIFGADQGAYDGLFTITSVPSANTFTVTLTAAAPGPSTGQAYVRRADNKHFGWDWFNPADGGGKSLELINPNLSNNQGQNWGPSLTTDGTPGAPNSIASANVAPLITNLKQSPAIPRSTDPVTITAKITDEQTTGLTVQTFYRRDGDPTFTAQAMFDDGLHGDGAAYDGVYGTILPAQTNGTVVEFYVKATDASANARTWPAPTDVTGEQGANALYQVDDVTYAGTQPLFKLIMTAAERAELDTIDKVSPDKNSNAAMNGTFISVDGTGTDVSYLAGFRNRGGGSRLATVSNYRVNFTNAAPWHHQAHVNLNAIYSASDVAGAALATRAGLPGQWATPVQVRVNNQNLATPGGTDGMYGAYSYVEAEDNAFVDSHFPADNQGNYYRAVDPNKVANLSYTTDPATLQRLYPKQTNVEANDYSDLINLMKVFNTSFTPDASFASAASATLNVDEWMRYFAFNILVGNFETSLGTGYGDDYALYRGVVDPRFQLVVHDLDSILNLGDPTDSPPPPPINQSIFHATAVASVKRLLQAAEFAPVYFKQLKDLADNVFTTAEVGKVLHHALDGYLPKSIIDAAVAQATARAQAALAQIPQTLAVTTAPPASNGYARVTNAAQLTAMTLGGSADAIATRSVRVNGQLATYTPYQGAWTLTNANNALGLNAGLNRVVVQALDGAGKEVGRTFVDVWYSGATGTAVSGAIAADTTWSPAAGPYTVTGNVTVNAGATLTILPGTTVYFADNTRLTINGVLNAVGSDPTGSLSSGHIRFSHDPAVKATPTSSWAGIYFSNASGTIAYADIEFAGVGGPDTQIASSTITLDHDTWATPGSGQRIIDITGASSFAITNSVIPTLVNAENVHFLGSIPAGGQALIQGNVFGTTTGHNDIIDFTGPNRPGPIFQIRDNLFTGTGTGGTVADDILDVDGTDAHIEGNVFLNVQPSPDSDTNSAISGGQDGTNRSEIVSVRNYFYNVDHAFLMKEGDSVTSINDTFVKVRTGVFNFDEPGFAAFAGLAGYVDGAVFYDVPKDAGGNPIILQNPPTGSFVVKNSITPSASPITGPGNLNLDPRLLNTAKVLDPRLDFVLKPFSPAIGAGPNGADMGAAVPPGATISGEPAGTTPLTSATLTVGNPAIRAYQWRLDNGPWSAVVNVTNPFTAGASIPPIVLTGLANGPHTVYVVAQDSAGVWQSQSAPTVSKTWTVDASLGGRVRINEVMADNQTALANAGTHPDVIELYNDGGAAIDLSDYSISDNPASPRKFVFPAGTTLAAGQYLLLYADSATSAPGIHLGFSLSADGEGVYLYNRLSAGGALVDSVAFGMQLTDYSIGRLGGGTTWALTRPTFGAPNVPAPTGNPATLKLNEWQASGVAPFAADYVELYNPDSLPVALAGLSITDRAAGDPRKHTFGPLNFAPAKGYLKLTADNDTASGANHLSFQLDADRGEIALFDAAHQLVDFVFYAAQTTGVSEGLSPDGSGTYVFFPQPNPGVSNPAGQQPVAVNLLKVDDTWQFNPTDLFDDTSWAQPGYIETNSWLPGAGLIYEETAALPWPKNTQLTGYSNTHPAYYFRKTFKIADPSAVTSLTLTALIDDGAVFYLNGQEIPGTRYNMPPGTITSTTQASTSIPDATTFQTFTIPVSMLVAGDNVLAVEVHQNLGSGTSTDMVFGVALDATEYPTNPPPPPPVRVTELMYNPPGSAAVSGDEYEYVELENTGTTPLDLTGYRFTAGIDFTFGNFTLAPGEGTVVVKDLAAFQARYGNSIRVAGQYLDALDNGGETVRLETADGQFVQSFTYAGAWYPVTDGAGGSLVINDPGADPSAWSSAASWHASTAVLGTPGLDESAAPVPPHAVVVNEVLANSPGAAGDWIELRNTTAAAIDVSGWYLSDSAGDLLKFRIPAGTVIPANGYVTFDEAGGFGAAALGDKAFALSSGGDDLYLSSATGAGVLGAYREGVHFGPSDAGVTLGRYTTSTGRTDFVALATPTRGADNALPRVGPVVINEVMYHPSGSGGDEWIELRNVTSAPVSLDGWRFTDGVDFTFPAGTTIPAGGLMLVVPPSVDVAEFRAKYAIPASVPVIGGFTGALANEGESLVLAHPGTPAAPGDPTPYIVVDQVDYGVDTPWPAAADGGGSSLARVTASAYGNDPANWRASTTPGGTPGLFNDVSPVTAVGQWVEATAGRLRFTFTADVSASLGVEDLRLVDTATGARIDPASIAVAYDAATNTVTFTFPGLPGGILPAGRYRATLLAAGIAAGGTALDGNADGTPGDDYVFEFFTLPGDANRDGAVNFLDLLTLAKNYGKTGVTLAQGDFSGDGTVNFADLLILAKNYNRALPSAGGVTPASTLDAAALAAAMRIVAPTASITTADSSPLAAAKQTTVKAKPPSPHPVPKPVTPTPFVARPATAAAVAVSRRDDTKINPVFSTTLVPTPAPKPMPARSIRPAKAKGR
jgi:hypothetical protein